MRVASDVDLAAVFMLDGAIGSIALSGFVILSEVEESLNVVWPLHAWFDRKSQRCFPFDSLRSLRADLQNIGFTAVNWMQRHVAAQDDRKR